MANTTADGGALGWAIYVEDCDAWDILDTQPPGDSWDRLNSRLSQRGASVSVGVVEPDVVLGGYNIFGFSLGGHIIAFNPTGGGNFAAYWFAGKSGDRVLCHWNMRSGQ